MPKIARAVAEGLPHHITQRGNYRQVIFRTDADYLQHLEWLRTFNLFYMRYAQYVHRRRRATGHLWQGRFYSTILDEVHAYATVRSGEKDPVRAGMVQKARSMGDPVQGSM